MVFESNLSQEELQFEHDMNGLDLGHAIVMDEVLQGAFKPAPHLTDNQRLEMKVGILRRTVMAMEKAHSSSWSVALVALMSDSAVQSSHSLASHLLILLGKRSSPSQSILDWVSFWASSLAPL